MYSTLVLDSSGNPHVSYQNTDFGPALHYSVWTGSTWTYHTVDTADEVFGFDSLALDSADHPHLIYYLDEALRHVYWTGYTGVFGRRRIGRIRDRVCRFGRGRGWPSAISVIPPVAVALCILVRAAPGTSR